MAKAFRIWIDVEEFDTDVPDDGENVPQDFGPSAVFVARDDTDVSVSRARDRAESIAEQLHEAAGTLRP